MFENVLFFAVSAICTLSSDFSVCYTYVLKFNFITQQFLLVPVQGLVLSPRRRIPLTALLITHYWFLKGVQLYRA